MGEPEHPALPSPSEQGSLGQGVTLTQTTPTQGAWLLKKKKKRANIFTLWNHPKPIFKMGYTNNKEGFSRKHKSRLSLYCKIHFCTNKAHICAHTRQGREGERTPTTLAHHKNVNYSIQQTDCNFQLKDPSIFAHYQCLVGLLVFFTEQWH